MPGARKAAWLVGQYRLYVEDGNTPLVSCPYWMVQVGEFLREYRSKMEAKTERDRVSKERQEKLLEQNGFGR